ncbi:MAG: hypothetical protein CM15mP3_07140 [Candidatus Poseidoniales archaeon]|nr:MAG: hypothetical protein CM15mP3_07140 [Candidatus Poseidoniales archaeon]
METSAEITYPTQHLNSSYQPIYPKFPYLDELEINLDWDIQGYLHDYLYVEFSFDNGQSWNPISGNYGIPGLGVLA